MASFEDNNGYLRISFYVGGKRKRLDHPEHLKFNRQNRREQRDWLKALTVAAKRKDFDLDFWFPSQRTRKAESVSCSPGPVTIGKYARRWLADQELTEKTRRDYEYLFAKFLDRTPLGAMAVADVTRADIAEAIRGGSPRRVTMLLQRLRSILQRAIDDEIREKNPAKLIPNPKKPKRKPPRTLTELEQMTLTSVARGRDRWFIALALGTGARVPSEIVRIQRKDIDLKNRRLWVRGTKTEEAPRYVNPEPIAMSVLEEIVRAPGIGVFGRLNFSNWRDNVWPRLLKESGIEYLNPYKLRHTYVLNRLEEGRTPLWIARQLGHTSTAMVDRVYGRFAPNKAVGE